MGGLPLDRVRVPALHHNLSVLRWAALRNLHKSALTLLALELLSGHRWKRPIISLIKYVARHMHQGAVLYKEPPTEGWGCVTTGLVMPLVRTCGRRPPCATAYITCPTAMSLYRLSPVYSSHTAGTSSPLEGAMHNRFCSLSGVGASRCRPILKRAYKAIPLTA